MIDYFIPNVRRGANRYDGHALVADMYPQQRSPLWRYHSNGLMIRAATAPQGDYTFVEKEIFYPQTGEVVEFDLVANASIQKGRRDENNQKLNNRRLHFFPNQQIELQTWLLSRSNAHGFDVLDMAIDSHKEIVKRKGIPFDINVTEYQGLILIKDAEVFKQVIQTGLSSMKAFGLGLILVSPSH